VVSFLREFRTDDRRVMIAYSPVIQTSIVLVIKRLEFQQRHHEILRIFEMPPLILAVSRFNRTTRIVEGIR
jgi:hypothetical protein